MAKAFKGFSHINLPVPSHFSNWFQIHQEHNNQGE